MPEDFLLPEFFQPGSSSQVLGTHSRHTLTFKCPPRPRLKVRGLHRVLCMSVAGDMITHHTLTRTCGEQHTLPQSPVLRGRPKPKPQRTCLHPCAGPHLHASVNVCVCAFLARFCCSSSLVDEDPSCASAWIFCQAAAHTVSVWNLPVLWACSAQKLESISASGMPLRSTVAHAA